MFNNCLECLEHAPSKNDPSYDVVPNELNILAANEEVLADFMDVLGEDILVIKDRASGHIWTKLTKDKTIQSTVEAFTSYFNLFDRPTRVLSDGGPAFMQSFTDFLSAWHVAHHLTSAHRPQSNGDGESGIKSIKKVLLKINKVDEKTLEQVTFNYNNKKCNNGSGSPSERFFGCSLGSSSQIRSSEGWR